MNALLPLIRAFVLAGLVAAAYTTPLLAQGKAPPGGGTGGNNAGGTGRSKSIPHDGYWATMPSYYDGDYKSALNGFRDAARSGVASTEGRWIDSICYYTMLGECYYQMGDLGSALDQYNAALELYLFQRDWMLRVDFPPGIDPNQNIRNTITWGKTSRTAAVGKFQERYQSLQGRLDNDKVIEKGGIVAAPQYIGVNVVEIIRCTATAIRRRREIMGPACEYDIFTGQIIDALARRPGPPNHWAQCWVELELGLAYACGNKPEQAVAELQRSLLAGGAYDHPLTGMGLLELGKLAFEQQKYDVATTFFIEATYTASLFDQYDVMEEAFRGLTQTYLVTGHQGPQPPLLAASAWAKQQRLRRLSVSLLTDMGECLAETGDLAAAVGALGQAKTNQGRSNIAASALGARLNYQLARVAFDGGNLQAGNTALAAAMAFQVGGSKRLYQIGMADRVFGAGGVTERVADILYSNVLREPTSTDWIVDPMETMSVQLAPLAIPYEHWFELAVVRKEYEKALEISDRIRRRRFFATLPLGGRTMAFRWLLEAPNEALDETARLQRQDLLVRFPHFAEISQQMSVVRQQLDALPLNPPADDPASKQQRQYLDQIGKLAAEQELMLQQMSLRRLPSEFVFPPLRKYKDLQKALPEGRLVLIYFQTSRNVHAFAFTSGQYAYFTVEAPKKVQADVVDLLKKLGQVDRNQPVDAAVVQSDAWKAPAAKLVKQLTNNSTAAEWAKYEEVIVVPDGVLWYLPFEVLQVPQAEGSETLANLMRLRYVPTMSLALPDGRTRKPQMRTAIVAGKLLPRDGVEVAEAAAADLATVEARSTVLTGTMPPPSSIFSGGIDRLILLSDVEDVDRGSYNWSPLALDRGKPGSTLSDWMLLPWDGPEQLILPGYHTAAEFGLRKGGNGEEVFLSVCGAMSTGARTILMSRWRVGGQSSVNLVREFVQELPHAPADQAWRRSVQLWQASLLDPTLEGRLKPSQSITGTEARHPFFWAGYMLVDTGSEPTKETPPAAAAEAAE